MPTLQQLELDLDTLIKRKEHLIKEFETRKATLDVRLLHLK
jgi:hypothetical protein